MTTRARLLERIRVTLAGRAAEELVLGDATTYSVKDLRVRQAQPEQGSRRVMKCGSTLPPCGQTAMLSVKELEGHCRRPSRVRKVAILQIDVSGAPRRTVWKI